MKRTEIREIVLSFRQTKSVSKTANDLGIARTTVYRWLKRGKSISQGLTSPIYTFKGVVRKSTRPKTIHYKLSKLDVEELVRIRNRKHVGARKLVHVSNAQASWRTIHRLLKKLNLVEKQVQYRRPKFQNGYAMRPRNTTKLGYLQMDTKHVTPELSGLPFTVFEYAAIDILSRYKLAVILPDISSESASLALEFFLKWFPFPVKYIQTDNGLEYQFQFEDTCRKHNINHYFIHKNSPNENAVIERSFRTDQDEFYYWLEDIPEHMGQLNEWLQKFINEYNTWRPHQALDYKTPIEFVKLYQKS
jgi:transposase InsO family protein